MKVFDSLKVLERSLDVRMAAQNQLSANIANIDTPRYAPQSVDFEASMEGYSKSSEMALSHGSHLPVGGGQTHGGAVRYEEDFKSSATLDDNTVDLDHTMAQMAENGLQFQAVAKAAQKKLALLRYVANDGVG